MLPRCHSIRWLCLVGILLLPWLVSAADSFRVASYNLNNYFLNAGESRPQKSPESLDVILQSVMAARPDILAVQEMSDATGLAHLQSQLRQRGLDLPHREIITGWDTNIHVAVLSRFPIAERRPHLQENYLLNGRRFQVSRGFLEVELQIAPDYELTLLCAHLKSKRRVAAADQADMRLEEAKLLRRKIDARLQLDPNENIVVLGDFNDTQNSQPIRTIVGRGRMKLGDTRPTERNGDSNAAEGVAWTYHYALEDSYTRVDYIMASPGLMREWVSEETYAVRVPDWSIGSDHRPIVAAFVAEDR